MRAERGEQVERCGVAVLLTSLGHRRSTEGPHEELLLVVVDACGQTRNKDREKTHQHLSSGGPPEPHPNPQNLEQKSDNTPHAAEGLSIKQGKGKRLQALP